MKAAYSIDRFGHYTLYEVDNESNHYYYQMDWERPSLAMMFGWAPCHKVTDGTIDCSECGKSVDELIASATDFLESNEGEVVEVDADILGEVYE